MIRFLIRLRLLSFGAVLALLVVLALFGKDVQYDQSIQAFFAEDDPAVVAYRDASALFGNDQFIFVCYDDPDLLTPEGMDRVAELASELSAEEIDGVVGMQSLDKIPVFWKLDDYLFALERIPKLGRSIALSLIEQGLRSGAGGGQWATPTIGQEVRQATPEELPELRDKITNHPLMLGTLVSAEGTSTALMLQLKPSGDHDAKETVTAIRERADAFTEKHALSDLPAIVGPPVLLADGFLAIERDGQRLAFAGMLLIGLVTLTATRSLWWAAVPLLAGWTTWLATETIVALLDLELSLSAGPLVAQIIVLTMPAASHLALHFINDRRRMPDSRAAADETLRTVSEPILWCALTSTIGYGALVTSNVVPIRQFGTILAIATGAAALITLIISPVAMRPPFRLDIPVRYGSTSRVSAAMHALIGWVYRRPALVIIAMLAPTIPLLAGMAFLSYESNYINAFKHDTRVVQDYYKVESRLGGIGLVGLVLPVEESLGPDSLDRFRNLGREVRLLRGRDGAPAVAHVLSLSTVLDPDDRLEGLEEERQAWLLETKLGLIAASPQAEYLGSFWNQGEGKARVLLRLSEQQTAAQKEATFVRSLDLARAEFGETVYLTGLSHLLTQTTRGVMATQWTTFALASFGILAMLVMAFRKPVLAALAILPTLLAVGLVLGLMGWLGLKLDIATALVASVALGLSIDDTFHCLLQFRRRRLEQSFAESLFASYAVTGPGVLLSSLAVAAGFAVLQFSEFVPFATFGLMVAIAVLGSTLGNLLLLPACLSLANRFHPEDEDDPAPTPARVDWNAPEISGVSPQSHSI
ncbi:MMPL family transporter [soil metagenome]